MTEMNLRCEQPDAPVGELDRELAAQHSHVQPAGGDGGEAEPLPGGTVHPAAEPMVAGVEVEPAEQQGSAGGVVTQLLGEAGGRPGYRRE
jgi:hypothetical protein